MKAIEDSLQECMWMIQNGASIEETLAHYPQWADELRPLLVTAQAMRQVGSTATPPRAAMAHSRAAFLQAARKRAPARSRFFPFQLSQSLRIAVLAVILLMFGALGAVRTSAKALPGEPLYPVKLASEKTLLMFAGNPVRRVELEQNFAAERRGEVEALIERSRSAEVEFSGDLTEMGSDAWMVGGIRVLVNQETRIDSALQAGFTVEVKGELQPSGDVLASRIRAEETEIQGTLQQISPGQWLVNGIKVVVTPNTEIKNNPVIGSWVKVEGFWLVQGTFAANEIEVEEDESLAPTQVGPRLVTEEPGDDRQTPEVDDHGNDDDEHEIQPTPRPAKTEDSHDGSHPEDDGEDGEDGDHSGERIQTPEPTEQHEDDKDGEDHSGEDDEDHSGSPSTPKPTEHHDGGDEDHSGEHTPEPDDD